MITGNQYAVPGTKVELNERIVILFGAAVLLLGAVLWADHAPLTEKTDFSVTYIGSRIVHDGRGPKLYDLDEQQRIRASLLKNAEPLIYEHPPFEALLLSPLGGLPYRTAYLIWGLFNASIWLVLPWLVRPYAPAPRDELAYLALWFVFAPLGIALYQGQSSLLLLLLYTATFTQLRHGHEVKAGLLLALGLFKFQFVLPFVLIFLLRRRWKFVAGFTVTALALGILSLIAVGWQGILGYVNLLSAIGRHPANASYGAATDMATLQGFVHALLGNSAGTMTVWIVVLMASVCLICFVALRWNRAEQESSNPLMFAAAVVVSLITGFHMFTHDLSPLLLAMFLVSADLPKHGNTGLRATLQTILVLFWVPALYFVLIAWHCMYLLVPVLMAFALATLRLAKNPDGLTVDLAKLPAGRTCSSA